MDIQLLKAFYATAQEVQLIESRAETELRAVQRHL